MNSKVHSVYCRGRLIAKNGEMLEPVSGQSLDTLDPVIQSSVNIQSEAINLSIPALTGKIRVITCADGQIVTGQRLLEPKVHEGHLISDIERDILKIAVIERHHGSQAVGLGFVQGLGLKQGAIASTVAHDSHNLIVAGTSDDAMLQAISAVTEMDGGLAVTGDSQPYATLSLPIAGLMSAATAMEVSSRLEELHSALARVETAVKNPFMLLSFLALPVIPELKITDKGLINVREFKRVALQA